MWKGHRREGHAKVGAFRDIPWQPVRAPDQKNDGLDGVVFGAAEPVGKLMAAEAATVDFEGDHSRAIRDVPRELLGYVDRIPVFDFDFFELCIASYASVVVIEQRPKAPILRFPNGNDTYAHDATTLREHEPLVGLLAFELDSIRIEPQRFEVVVSACVLMKDMHDYIPEIEQHPAPLRQPFHPGAAHSVLALEIFLDASRNRRDLSIAPTAHHDHVVGVVDFASHIDDLDSDCFLVERCLGDFQR